MNPRVNQIEPTAPQLIIIAGLNRTGNVGGGVRRSDFQDFPQHA